MLSTLFESRDYFRSSRRNVGFLAAVSSLLGVLLTAPGAAAQEVRVIGFEEAVGIALEQNSTLLRVENSASLARIDVAGQRSQFLPDLRFSTRGSQNYGRYFSQEEGRILTEGTQSFSAGLSSSLTLFDGFENFASLEQARYNRSAAESDLQRARETVVINVIDNYLTMMEAEEQVRVRAENLTAQEEQEVQIREYVDAGARPISDLFQQQANVASARLALVEARRTQELSKESIIQTLQLDPTGTYAFEAPRLSADPMETGPYSVAELLDEAFTRRTDLTAAETQVFAAEQAIRAVQGRRWPTVSLSAGYDTGFNSTSDFGLIDQLDQRRGGSIGLNLSIPIFDRSSTSQQSRRARLQAENARLAVQEERQAVAAEVRRAYLDYESALEQVSAAEAQLQAADRALASVQERYDAGAATLVELTQARSTQVEADSRLIQARFNVVAQDRFLAYYSGRLTPDGPVLP